MASKVQIWNLSLANIQSTSAVQGENENSTEANFCRVYYDDALKEILAKFPWNFATKRLKLAETGTIPPDWAKQYTYPNDCLKIINIVQAARTNHDPVPFEVAVNSDNKKVILSDLAEVELRYVFDLKDASFFSQPFTIALSWALSAKISIPITGNIAIKKGAEVMQARAERIAYEHDHNEGRRDPERESAFTRERY